ncbi:hypothetical protein Tco_0625282 [Tanacetum coccineum]|uniref:Uncharacterized protein n=1 Tax=Tanacetum coccineum TaxID=301880 RepID=A0ABQ4WGE2_9ASTR
MVAAIIGFWCRLHTRTPDPPSRGLPLHIHVSTRNGGSKPVENTEGFDIERSNLGENIGVLSSVATDIESCGTSDQAMVNYSYVHCFWRCSLLNPVSWWGGHMVAAITGFCFRLHTRTPEPSSCGLPFHIHVSTYNGGSKLVGNTKGSDIERSDLGRNIGVLGNVTTDIGSCGTSDQGSKPVGNTKGSDIERSDLGGNIRVLGNVTTYIGSCGTSDQVVFLIMYFTSGHLTTTATSIDNVGSPEESYMLLCWRPLIVYYRMLFLENTTGKLLIFLCNMVTEEMMNFSCIHCFLRRSLLNPISWRGGHMVAAITGFWSRLHTRMPKPSLCGLPLYIHVSTRNGGSKPVGNTEGSDIERYDLGVNIGVLGGHLTTTPLPLTMWVVGTGYSLKDKNKAKPDKTEHEMEKRRKAKVKSKPKSQTVKVQVNPQVNSQNRATTEEY